jgi:hypothetical protein
VWRGWLQEACGLGRVKGLLEEAAVRIARRTQATDDGRRRLIVDDLVVRLLFVDLLDFRDAGRACARPPLPLCRSSVEVVILSQVSYEIRVTEEVAGRA